MKLHSRTLAILVQTTDNFWRRKYLIQLMFPRWEAMGYHVKVVTEDDPIAPAAAALLHPDQSVVPDKIRWLAEGYSRVLNGRVFDIRKRRFSRQLLDRGDPWPGKVMVKTDWNCGGGLELRWNFLKSPLGRFLNRVRMAESICRKIQRREARRSWREKRVLNNLAYPIFDSLASVPAGVWENPNLIVERFLAERDGNDHCCRHWLFFGPCEVGRRTISRDPVVKFDARLEPLHEPVPEPLRGLRRQWGFDYGKFDYGIVDGEVVLYDLNRTPGASADPGRHANTIDVLAEGIREMVPLT
jgi:hypothetical protein